VLNGSSITMTNETSLSMKAPKKIEDLIPDIYDLLSNREKYKINDEDFDNFGKLVANMMRDRMGDTKTRNYVSMSSFAEPNRKLWYRVNAPEKAEKLTPNTYLKFLYGDMVELLILFLAKAAGHDVQGEQEKVEYKGIPGTRDAVIDGRIIDVKSANSRGMYKFKNNALRMDDPFGYLDQIMLYGATSIGDDKVTDKENVSFLAVDKELGHLVLDTYPVEHIPSDDQIKTKYMMVNGKMPERCYPDEEEGKSGNRKLCMQCTYCPFKKDCWPGVRTFIYSKGPVFLTKVVKEPDVPEVA